MRWTDTNELRKNNGEFYINRFEDKVRDRKIKWEDEIRKEVHRNTQLERVDS